MPSEQSLDNHGVFSKTNHGVHGMDRYRSRRVVEHCTRQSVVVAGGPVGDGEVAADCVVMALGAHPAGEVLGCGGFRQRSRAGCGRGRGRGRGRARVAGGLAGCLVATLTGEGF